MLRQAAEAVYIRDNKPLLNSKSEFGNMKNKYLMFSFANALCKGIANVNKYYH